MIITCPACATQFRVDGTRILASGTKVRCARCSHVWLQTPDAALPYTPPAAKAAPPPAPAPRPAPIPEPEFVVPPAMRAPPEAAPEPAPPPPEPLPNLSRLRALNPEREPEAPAEARPPMPARQELPVKAAPARPSRAFPAEDAERPRLPVILIAGLLAVMLAVGGIVYALLHYRGAIVSAVPPAAKAYCAVGLGLPMGGLLVKDVKAERTFSDGMPYLEIRGQVVNNGAAPQAVPHIRAALRDKSGKELYSWIISASAARLKPTESADFSSRLPSPDPQSAMLTVGFATPCS